MQSSAPGVHDGASKMPHVPMSLRAASMHRINSMWAKGAGVPGAGPVVKNTAALTMILPRDNVYRRRKITTILFVAVRRLDSRKRTTVEEGILVIVQGDGLLNFHFIG